MAGLYSILELPIFSDADQIRKNYKKLALKYHPDVNRLDPRAEEKFKRINHAYQILSNETKKRRYDEILRYQINKPKESFASNHSSNKGSKVYRPKPKKVKKQSKKLYNAMTLAFFGIGLILFQAISYFNEKRIENNFLETFKERQEVIEKSKMAFTNKDFRKAIYILNTSQYAFNSDEIHRLKYNYLQFFDSVSREQFIYENYDSALYFLEIILAYKPKVDLEVYSRISDCYRLLGQTDNAIDILNKLLEVNPNNLVVHKELAEIYQRDLGDFNRSLIHYESATKIIVKNYVNFYGKAYIAVLDPSNHPKSDFDVFLEKAKIYYTLNEIDSSLIASRWATFLEPGNSEAHFVLGLCWLKKGDNKKACREFNTARNQDYILPRIDSLLKSAC